jgi:hypothetical protein
MAPVTTFVKVETLPLRIEQAKEVEWRIRAREFGLHKVSIELGTQKLEKQVLVDQNLARLSSSRLDSGFWQALLHPGESPLSEQSGIERIDVTYPTRWIKVSSWETHWLVVFFVLSIVFAFAFKRAFKVEI